MQHEHHALASRQNAGSKQAFIYSLPVPLTSLVGREQEMAQICAWLHRPEVPLLTLTGAGGVGKTRLALAVAQHVLDDFPDGVYFVALAPVSDPERVTATIAQALGLWEASDRPLLEQLLEYLREKHLMLLLDNFEQVAAAAPQLTDLLTSCPHLSVLVTSRAALHLSGEHEFVVSPLAVPDLVQLPVLADLAHVATVRLFVERAQAVKANFQLTEANAHTIAAICVHLDGLPLALELAAARIKLLPPQALLKRLSHRLDLLTGGAHDLPSRQQTLRNTIQWSYDLLSPQEQGLFRRLSVFVGGCTLEAAGAVCRWNSSLTPGVLDAVASLLDKSLVQQTEQEDEEPRLLMLATIREFGLECLQRHGELKDARQAYALYYLALAETTQQRLFGSEQGAWLNQMEREYENLQAAIDWFIEDDEIETVLRCGTALWPFWWMHGHLNEGRAVLERVFTTPPPLAPAVQAMALTGAGILIGEQGHYRQARALCEQGLALFRELQNARGIITALWMLGRVAYNLGESATARALGEEALSIAQQTHDPWGLAAAQEVLTATAIDMWEPEEAHTHAEDYLTAAHEAGDTRAIARALLHLGAVCYISGDLAGGFILIQECLVRSREVGDARNMAYALLHLGYITILQGDYTSGLARLEEGLTHAQRVGDREPLLWVHTGQALASFGQGHYQEARTRLEESLSILRQWDYRYQSFLVLCLGLLGGVAVALGMPTWAARLWGMVEALGGTGGSAVLPIVGQLSEPFKSAARAQLGLQAFQAALAEGRALSLEQVLEPPKSPAPSDESEAWRPTAPVALSRRAVSFPAGLTAREVEVLRLVAQGMTDAQVAEQLVVSHRTVTTHLTSIYNKLGVNSRTAAARFAVEHHLL